jgi:hypothetical protein
MSSSGPCSKNASKSVCTSTAVVFADSLPASSSIASAVKTPENTEDDPEPAGGGDTQVEYFSDLLYSPSVGAVTKNYV